MYAPLWCKTNFSFLEGASHPEELIETAAQLELPAVAITDRNGVYGMVRAFDAARQGKVRLIIGSQVSIDDGSSIVLLVQDRAGYANLCRLISRGHLRNVKPTCFVSWKEVAQSARGIVALWLNDAPDPSQRESGLGILKEAFGDRLYAVVARHRWVDDVARERTTREVAARFAPARRGNRSPVPPARSTEASGCPGVHQARDHFEGGRNEAVPQRGACPEGGA